MSLYSMSMLVRIGISFIAFGALLLFLFFFRAQERANAPSTEPTYSATSSRPLAPYTHPHAVLLGESVVYIDIADTEGERRQGLSGRMILADERGLLFVFPEEGYHSMWMKDMHFPLDILWLDNTFTVMHVEYDVAPETFPRVFTSPTQARFVLEVNAGMAQKAGVSGGSVLSTVEFDR